MNLPESCEMTGTLFFWPSKSGKVFYLRREINAVDERKMCIFYVYLQSLN